MKNKPKIRTVKIKRIYETPKLLKEGKNYNFYSFGIKLDDDSYVNITTSAKDEEEAIEKTKSKFICDEGTKEKIQEGKEYVCYEESTDEEEKYWRVTGFVKPEDDARKSKTDAELEKENKKINKEMRGSGGTPQSTFGNIQKERERRIVRQAVLKATAEIVKQYNNPTMKVVKEIAEELEEWVFRK